ncbi:hypothetical protein HDV63DRAFT_377467 [Trichoderma sp. SZMC 28014]
MKRVYIGIAGLIFVERARALHFASCSSIHRYQLLSSERCRYQDEIKHSDTAAIAAPKRQKAVLTDKAVACVDKNCVSSSQHIASVAAQADDYCFVFLRL